MTDKPKTLQEALAQVQRNKEMMINEAQPVRPVSTVKTKGGDYPVYAKSSAPAQSFRDTFAAKRKELGPGKTFEWQGRSYSTNMASDKPGAKPAEKPTAKPAAPTIKPGDQTMAGQDDRPSAEDETKAARIGANRDLEDEQDQAEREAGIERNKARAEKEAEDRVKAREQDDADEGETLNRGATPPASRDTESNGNGGEPPRVGTFRPLDQSPRMQNVKFDPIKDKSGKVITGTMNASYEYPHSPMIEAFLKLNSATRYNIFAEAKKMKEATDDEVNAIIKGTPGSSKSKTDDISGSKSAKDSSTSTSEKGGGERSSKTPETKNTESKPESKPTIKPTDQTMSGQDDDNDAEERERQELQKKLGPGKVVLRRGERGFVGPEGKFRQLPKKSEDEKYVPSDDDEEDDRRALKSWQRLGKDEDEIAKAFYPGSRKTGEQSPEEMLSMHRAQRAARRAEEGKKKTNEGYVFGEAKGSHPDTPKEKSLAALGHPKNKITHKDVLIGRGVLAKEENDEGTAGAVRRNGRDVVSPTAPGGSGYKKEGPSDRERDALTKKIDKIQKERPTNESVEFSEAELAHIAAIMEMPIAPVADDYSGYRNGPSKRDLSDETIVETKKKDPSELKQRGRKAGVKVGSYARKDVTGAEGEEAKAEPKNLVAQNPRTYNKEGKNFVDLEHPSKPGVTRTVPAKHYNDFRSSYLNTEKPAEKQKMHDSMVDRVFGKS